MMLRPTVARLAACCHAAIMPDRFLDG